jgi:hypothetical protein
MSQERTRAIVAETLFSVPVPATLDELDPQYRRFLEVQASRRGMTAQQLLDEHRAEHEAAAEQHRNTQEAVAAIRARR